VGISAPVNGAYGNWDYNYLVTDTTLYAGDDLSLAKALMIVPDGGTIILAPVCSRAPEIFSNC